MKLRWNAGSHLNTNAQSSCVSQSPPWTLLSLRATKVRNQRRLRKFPLLRFLGFFLLFPTFAQAQISAIDRDLINAAERGDVAAVKTLLAKGASVNAQDEKRDSAFLV